MKIINSTNGKIDKSGLEQLVVLKRGYLYKLLCTVLLISTGLSDALGTKGDQKKLNYVEDKAGRTFIFRKNPCKETLIVLSLYHAIFGLCVMEPFEQRRPSHSIEKSGFFASFLMIEVLLAPWSIVELYYYFYNLNQIRAPLIVLDKKGLKHGSVWHSSQHFTVLWADITDINFNKKHHYARGTEVNGFKIPDRYLGFSWNIELTTKQGKRHVIYESYVRNSLHQSSKDLTGGKLGRLLLNYYDKYKEKTDTMSKK